MTKKLACLKSYEIKISDQGCTAMLLIKLDILMVMVMPEKHMAKQSCTDFDCLFKFHKFSNKLGLTYKICGLAIIYKEIQGITFYKKVDSFCLKFMYSSGLCIIASVPY